MAGDPSRRPGNPSPSSPFLRRAPLFLGPSEVASERRGRAAGRAGERSPAGAAAPERRQRRRRLLRPSVSPRSPSAAPGPTQAGGEAGAEEEQQEAGQRRRAEELHGSGAPWPLHAAAAAAPARRRHNGPGWNGAPNPSAGGRAGRPGGAPGDFQRG